MSRCCVCDHSIIAVCDQCGGELTVCDILGVEEMRGEATQVRIVPCGCPPNNDDFGTTFFKAAINDAKASAFRRAAEIAGEFHSGLSGSDSAWKIRDAIEREAERHST